MDTITLGSFIKERREQLGKTLRGFAAELDIAAPYLHDIEKDNRTPSEKLLPAFIKGLRLSREDETTLYDLVGRRRQGLYPDLSAYIQNSELARVALRKARDCNIPDTMIQKRRDWELVEIFADEGLSGMKAENRTEFQRMIRMCELHQIDLIITKSVSRFARNAKESLVYVRKLKLLGIGVQFEKEGIFTLALGDEMLLNTFSAIAQEESKAISQNQRLSIVKRMKKIRYIPYGYTIRNGRMVIEHGLCKSEGTRTPFFCVAGELFDRGGADSLLEKLVL